LVGVVGTDFPAEHVDSLQSRGIDLSGLEVAEGKTFRWGGTYGGEGNEGDDRQTDFTELNVFERFQPVLSRAHREAATVFLANIHPSLQQLVLEQTGSPRVSLCDTMNLWLDTAPEAVSAVLDGVDVALMNDAEAKQCCDTGSPVAAGRQLLKRHDLRAAVIKKGEHGAILFQGSGPFLAPSYPLDRVVDPTGAGDAFAGALSGYLDSQGEPTDDALRMGVLYGSLVASFVVQDFSIDALRRITRAEVDARLGEWLEMTRVPDR
jgi:sugar/nucleoside kinase (ribokinase family)